MFLRFLEFNGISPFAFARSANSNRTMSQEGGGSASGGAHGDAVQPTPEELLREAKEEVTRAEKKHEDAVKRLDASANPELALALAKAVVPLAEAVLEAQKRQVLPFAPSFVVLCAFHRLSVLSARKSLSFRACSFFVLSADVACVVGLQGVEGGSGHPSASPRRAPRTECG